MRTIPSMTDTDTYEQPEELLPVGDVARILGVSVPTIRRWESQGKISATRTLGGQRRFARTEVERAKSGSAA